MRQNEGKLFLVEKTSGLLLAELPQNVSANTKKINYNLHPPLQLAVLQSYSIKYLGIVIDCFLSWHDHIDYVSSKISKRLNIITKIKCHVAKHSLISMYYALVYPYLTCGCVLWDNNYEIPVAQLVKLYNKVVRIINDVPLRDYITPPYVNLGLIKFPDTAKLYICLLFYDHILD